MIKVLLVEDSGFMRIVLSDRLRQDEGIKLVGTAANGQEGVEKAMELQPDIIVTDMIMPKYDGLYLVREIMRRNPIPIILLSSLEKSDTQVFDALKAGAIDFIAKPDLDQKGNGFLRLIDLIKNPSDYNLQHIAHEKVSNTNDHTFDHALNYHVITIGASTGGPGAIEELIKGLPANLAVPVVVAQHMPHNFMSSYANRLQQYTQLKVRIPTNGEAVLPGTIYLVPGNTNTKIIRGLADQQPIFRYTTKQYTEFNHPSINCLFTSISNVYEQRSLAVILTGMGKDGTEGLRAIRDSGGFTIAQDESSCVVYGMPKSASEANVVNIELKLKEIPGYLVSSL